MSLPMRYSTQIRPISYLKSHASEIVRSMAGQAEPLIITQNGEAKVVIQDVNTYEYTQETMALLKILALGNRQIEEGRVQTVEGAFKKIRARRADM